MLGEVADADIVSFGARASFEREQAGEDFEEGRFARSVGSDEDSALSSLDGQVEVLVDNVVAVCLAHMFEDHGALSAPGWLGKAEFDGGFRVFRRGEALDAGQLFDALLGLGGFARLGAKAVDEILEVLDFALLVFVSRDVLLVAGLFLDKVVVVVAAVAVELLARDLDDSVANGIEEGAVVRNDQESAGVVGEVVLKPTERLEVEVVGWLIEHEEVGFHGEEAGKVRAHNPSAAHGPGGAVEVRLAEGQAGEDAFGFGFEVVAVVFEEHIVRFVVLGGVFVGKLPQCGVGGGHRWCDARGELQDGFVAGRRAFLWEEADGASALETNRAFVGCVFAQDEREERGFSGTVCSDQADAVAGIDLQRGVREKGAAAEGFGDLGDGEHEE